MLRCWGSKALASPGRAAGSTSVARHWHELPAMRLAQACVLLVACGGPRFKTERVGAGHFAEAQGMTLPAGAYTVALHFDVPRAQLIEWTVTCPGVEKKGTAGETFEKYPTTGKVLPAMGYGAVQTRELAETIRATPADVVVIATPIDLRRLIEIDKTALRVRYELQEIGEPTLGAILRERLRTREAEVVRGG